MTASRRIAGSDGDDPDSELSRSVESVLNKRIDRFDWISHDDRLYSSVYFLNAMIDGQTWPLVVKRWSDESKYWMQMNASNRAREAFSGDESVKIPFIASDAQRRILIMERIPDPTIESLAHCSLNLAGLNLLRWKRRIGHACRAAGQWLARWHAHDTADADVADLLGGYVADRSDHLALLDREDKRKLLALIARLDRGPVGAVHGDFTPWNVLWSPQRLTVLDFGVGRWERMTPAWDLATMTIGIASELRFATRSPGRWFKRWAQVPIQEFEQGYGIGDCDPAALDACCAVRHLNLYAIDSESGRALRKRAQWHLASLRSIINNRRDLR